MRAEDVGAVAVAVVVPVLTAVVGAFAVVWQDRRVSRSRVGRRQSAFDDANRQVEFAVRWWEARQLVPGTPEESRNASAITREWLDQACALVVAAGPGALEPERRLSPRRLLLLYGFGRTSAKVIRVGFFAMLALMAVTSLGVLSVALSDGAGADLGWSVTWLVLFALVTLSLRFWAVSADAVRRP
ncbi:hypothetical protein [Embleya sp. NBC_00896]|uniref:hypothetical protein n=1 Tax=Embleya sp. NBC_00896 TaxID=2975961 RepID=UPI002F916C1F|nr:hypothetical protein OG928_42540 [Embleya sp. NBC_00896]